MITDTGILIPEFLKDQDVTEKTKVNFRNALNCWSTWLTVNGISFEEARKPHIIRYKNELADKGRSALYINNLLNILRKFYQWTDDAGYYADIASGVKGFKRYQGFRKKPLTAEQVAELLKSIDTTSRKGRREHLVINLMVTSGLRAVEVERLNIGDYSNGAYPGVNVLGKGRKEKTFVRISSEVSKEMKEYIGARIEDYFKPLFMVNESKLQESRLSSTYIGIMIKSRLKKIGIDDKLITAHSLRHTTAMMMIDAGASLFDVQNQLRHTDANMTRNYLRFIEEEKRKKMDWVDRLSKGLSKDRQTTLDL